MRLRVCGAPGERLTADQRRCWCKGYFCGKGGAKQSADFRRAIGRYCVARTLAEFQDLVAQIPLFDDDKLRDRWLARFLPEYGAVNVKPTDRRLARAIAPGTEPSGS